MKRFLRNAYGYAAANCGIQAAAAYLLLLAEKRHSHQGFS
jgi:hypothetical protein